jgi:hypothetical protein
VLRNLVLGVVRGSIPRESIFLHPATSHLSFEMAMPWWHSRTLGGFLFDNVKGVAAMMVDCGGKADCSFLGFCFSLVIGCVFAVVCPKTSASRGEAQRPP